MSERSVVDLTSQELDIIARQAFGEAAIASIIFKHVKASSHPHFVDRICISGIDDAAAAVFAALRASAAPEEGIEDELGLFELGRSFLEEYERYFNEGAFPNFICADSPVEIIVHLINERDEAFAALPSDSGKAAPVAWPDDKLAAWASNWHCNDCATNPVDPTIYFRDMRMLKAFRAALAPATEGGGREGMASVPLIAPTSCSCCNGPLHLNGLRYACDKQSSEEFHIDDLSLSPSVGTPAQPSAQGKTP